jgi:nicotinamide riboside kinase
MKYQNVYFINGNAYAGKSTIVKKLAEKYDGILCEENYHDQLQDTLDKKEFPALTYTRDLQDWGDFIRRTPDEYEDWINKVTEECAIIELKILNELVKKNKKIFVDTNIPVSMLKKISDKDHVLIMLTDPNESVNRFFDRPDLEKQFLYQLLLKEENPDLAIENFKNCLKRINSIENYNKFYTSGFNVLIKDESRSIDETLEIVEKYFKLK